VPSFALKEFMSQVVERPKIEPMPDAATYHPAWFARLPFAPWGWRELNRYGWPLVISIAVLVVAGTPWSWLTIVPGGLLAILLYFFRDPPRRIPTTLGAIVAPADGKVVEITQLEHDEFVDGPAVRIGIFLSLFNVHVNRAPTDGRVVDLKYRPGEFISATRPESSLRNESMWIGFEDADGRRFAVRQISGMVARRIVCLLRPGQAVTRGEKFGMIKLGSRTELILPARAVQIEVGLGESVRGGRQILASWKVGH
jgi:phosphatidylserine decarboxylase